MIIVTGKQMQVLDRRTINGGVSGELLMERAGTGAFEALLEFIELLPYVHRHRVVVINGKGNNGGDTRLAAEQIKGRKATLVEVSGQDCLPEIQEVLDGGPALVVDGLFGIGRGVDVLGN